MKDFIIILQMLEKGKKAKRNIWENANMDSIIMNEAKDGFVMRTKGGAYMPWSPSVEDMFSDDWSFMDDITDDPV